MKLVLSGYIISLPMDKLKGTKFNLREKFTDLSIKQGLLSPEFISFSQEIKNDVTLIRLKRVIILFIGTKNSFKYKKNIFCIFVQDLIPL